MILVAGYITQEEGEEGLFYGYSASYPQAVHDHINDVIQRCCDSGQTPPIMHCVKFYVDHIQKVGAGDTAHVCGLQGFGQSGDECPACVKPNATATKD